MNGISVEIMYTMNAEVCIRFLLLVGWFELKLSAGKICYSIVGHFLTLKLLSHTKVTSQFLLLQLYFFSTPARKRLGLYLLCKKTNFTILVLSQIFIKESVM